MYMNRFMHQSYQHHILILHITIVYQAFVYWSMYKCSPYIWRLLSLCSWQLSNKSSHGSSTGIFFFSPIYEWCIFISVVLDVSDDWHTPRPGDNIHDDDWCLQWGVESSDWRRIPHQPYPVAPIHARLLLHGFQISGNEKKTSSLNSICWVFLKKLIDSSTRLTLNDTLKVLCIKFELFCFFFSLRLQRAWNFWKIYFFIRLPSSKMRFHFFLSWPSRRFSLSSTPW